MSEEDQMDFFSELQDEEEFIESINDVNIYCDGIFYFYHGDDDHYQRNIRAAVEMICENKDQFGDGLSKILIRRPDWTFYGFTDVEVILIDDDGEAYSYQDANDIFCLKIAKMPEEEHYPGILDCAEWDPDRYEEMFTSIPELGLR